MSAGGKPERLKKNMKELTDMNARRIASSWYSGGGSALYAFVSTGAIDTARNDHAVLLEISECIPQAENNADRAELRALYAYAVKHGKRGPQYGWSSLTW